MSAEWEAAGWEHGRRVWRDDEVTARVPVMAELVEAAARRRRRARWVLGVLVFVLGCVLAYNRRG